MKICYLFYKMEKIKKIVKIFYLNKLDIENTLDFSSLVNIGTVSSDC